MKRCPECGLPVEQAKEDKYKIEYRCIHFCTSQALVSSKSPAGESTIIADVLHLQITDADGAYLNYHERTHTDEPVNETDIVYRRVLQQTPQTDEDKKIFESLESLMKAFLNKRFNPFEFSWFTRGSEVFINDKEGETLFNKYCGEVVGDVCAIFGVTPEAV